MIVCINYSSDDIADMDNDMMQEEPKQPKKLSFGLQRIVEEDDDIDITDKSSEKNIKQLKESQTNQILENKFHKEHPKKIETWAYGKK